MPRAIACQPPSRQLPSFPAALPLPGSASSQNHGPPMLAQPTTLMTEAHAMLLAVQLQASDADGWTYEAVPADPLAASSMFRVSIADEAGIFVGFL